MNDLSCKVTTCSYNGDDKCKKGSIKVEGPNADSKSATCCSSFAEEGRDKASSECNCEPKKSTNILCDAIKCMYNEARSCVAKHVDVIGKNAMVSSETECETFCAR